MATQIDLISNLSFVPPFQLTFTRLSKTSFESMCDLESIFSSSLCYCQMKFFYVHIKYGIRRYPALFDARYPYHHRNVSTSIISNITIRFKICTQLIFVNMMLVLTSEQTRTALHRSFGV